MSDRALEAVAVCLARLIMACQVATVFLLLLVVFAPSPPARAHEWFTDKINPVSKALCCNGSDCIPIAEDKWRQEGNEYVVRWFDNNEYRIPVNQAMPSQDRQGRAAGCVWGGMLKCFFVPLSG